MRTLLLVLTVLLAGCISSGTRQWQLAQATRWQLAEIEGAPALADARVTLRLEAGRRLFGQGGINSYFGSFERDGHRFRVGQLASTRKAGATDALQQEQHYLVLLEAAVRIDLGPGTLTLSGPEGPSRPLLHFVAQR